MEDRKHETPADPDRPADRQAGSPNLDEQQVFWNWHWAHWRERRTINAWKDRRNAEIVRLLRERGLAQGSLLELGCGPGHYAAPLTEFGRVTAIDLSNEAIQIARTKYPEIEFHAGDLYEYPLPLAHFDAVVAQEVFDHVPDQAAFLARVEALLKPGGYFAVSCTNRFVIERAPRTFPAQPSGHIMAPLTMRALRERLRTRFAILALYSILPEVGEEGIYRLLNSPKLNRLAGFLIPPSRIAAAKERMGFGYQLIALVRKAP
jgi:2-polyprenyl-3-methyl-5-hydroxy-6-metoxy-1,4-benzoquinol methylase